MAIRSQTPRGAAAPEGLPVERQTGRACLICGAVEGLRYLGWLRVLTPDHSGHTSSPVSACGPCRRRRAHVPWATAAAGRPDVLLVHLDREAGTTA